MWERGINTMFSVVTYGPIEFEEQPVEAQDFGKNLPITLEVSMEDTSSY